MKKKIKLAVVEDQLLVRQGIVALLKDYEELKIVVEASNGNELLEALKKNKVDVVITDIQMPEMDGIETTKAVRNKYPEIKVIALTQYDEEAFIIQLLENGANGFLLKGYDIELIVDAIYAVMENGYYFNDRISKAMVTGLVKSKKIIPTFKQPDLSEREIEIIRLICQQLSSKEIAEKLFISPRTIEGHRENIFEKTGAKNIAGVVMYAVKNGLVD